MVRFSVGLKRLAGKSLSEKWAERYSPKAFLEDKERIRYRLIEDVPVMVGIDGSIVCIPHRHEPNNIAVVGKKGTGKSLLLNRISGEIFYLWGEGVVLMNDVQGECFSWNEGMKNEEWISQLGIINEIPLAIPIIYIFPNTNTLNLDYTKLSSEINFISITIPFSEVIDKSEVYLKLGGSSRYVQGLKDDLLGCEIPQDVYDLIEEKCSGSKRELMKEKILVSFDNVFEEGILNITNKEYPYYLQCGNLKGNPFVVFLKIGVVPCFETSDLFTKRYMPEVFAYHLDSIFQSKFRGGLLHGEPVYIFFDELTHICSTENHNSAFDSVNMISARGRKLDIGICYATQNYSKIPQITKSNTDFLFAFQHSNEKEVNEIKKDFDLQALNKKEIMNLKDFEVLGITKEYFVCYKGGDRWEESGPIKGVIIPPQSNHTPPSRI